jgi:hypothetical protein
MIDITNNTGGYANIRSNSPIIAEFIISFVWFGEQIETKYNK